MIKVMYFQINKNKRMYLQINKNKNVKMTCQNKYTWHSYYRSDTDIHKIYLSTIVITSPCITPALLPTSSTLPCDHSLEHLYSMDWNRFSLFFVYTILYICIKLMHPFVGIVSGYISIISILVLQSSFPITVSRI